MLEQELSQIAPTQEVQETIATPHSIKYVVDGVIQTPQGKPLQLRTV